MLGTIFKPYEKPSRIGQFLGVIKVVGQQVKVVGQQVLEQIQKVVEKGKEKLSDPKAVDDRLQSAEWYTKWGVAGTSAITAIENLLYHVFNFKSLKVIPKSIRYGFLASIPISAVSWLSLQLPKLGKWIQKAESEKELAKKNQELATKEGENQQLKQALKTEKDEKNSYKKTTELLGEKLRTKELELNAQRLVNREGNQYAQNPVSQNDSNSNLPVNMGRRSSSRNTTPTFKK